MSYAATEQPLDFPSGRLVHVLMPCMSYACGGCICGCSGEPGTLTVGVTRWDDVTCPDCRSPGRPALEVEIRRQQGR